VDNQLTYRLFDNFTGYPMSGGTGIRVPEYFMPATIWNLGKKGVQI
jgi:hypothetical protein